VGKKRRRPMQGTEELERVVTLLSKSAVKEIDAAATEQGLSRSGLIRTVMLRYLQDRAKA